MPAGGLNWPAEVEAENLSIGDHSCTDSRRKTTTTPANPASATAICAAALRASPVPLSPEFNRSRGIVEELFYRDLGTAGAVSLGAGKTEMIA